MRSQLKLEKLDKYEAFLVYSKRLEKHMPATKVELAAKIGVSISVASNVIRWMRENKAAYISGWTKSGHADAPVYSEGCYTDAIRPMPKKRERLYVRRAKPEVVPFRLPARCLPRELRNTQPSTIHILPIAADTPKSSWIGGNPFNNFRVVHSCSSADVAYVRT